LNLSDHINGWLVHKAIISLQGNSMTNEIDCVFLQSEFFKHGFGWFIKIDFLMSLWVVLFEVLHDFHELLASSFFHQSHEIR
jgi:hypothetical protein